MERWFSEGVILGLPRRLLVGEELFFLVVAGLDSQAFNLHSDEDFHYFIPVGELSRSSRAILKRIWRARIDGYRWAEW